MRLLYRKDVSYLYLYRNYRQAIFRYVRRICIVNGRFGYTWQRVAAFFAQSSPSSWDWCGPMLVFVQVTGNRLDWDKAVVTEQHMERLPSPDYAAPEQKPVAEPEAGWTREPRSI